MGKFLITDATMALAVKVVAEVPSLTDEQRKALFDRVYDIIKEVLAEYEEKSARMHKRIEGESSCSTS